MKRIKIKSDAVRQRLSLLRLANKIGVSLACSKLGKHRSYYYYWKKRFDKLDIKGLYDRSRKPKKMPLLINKSLANKVIQLRKKTNYGKERIHILLLKRGIKIAISTIGKILKRANLLLKKRYFKTQKKHTRSYNFFIPGIRVQMDIKYVPEEVSPLGKRLYQYTVIDECTRMRYLEWHDSIWNLKAIQTLNNAIDYFGFKVDSVQTDNGIEFTYNYTAQLTAKHKDPVTHPLDIYCQQKLIQHKLIPPGEKELNGKVERSHRTDDEEFYRTITHRVKHLTEIRLLGQKWLNHYNYKRIHSAINYKTPAEFKNERLFIFPHRLIKSVA